MEDIEKWLSTDVVSEGLPSWSQQSCWSFLWVDFRQCITALSLLNVWDRLLGETREGKARDTGFGIPQQHHQPYGSHS